MRVRRRSRFEGGAGGLLVDGRMSFRNGVGRLLHSCMSHIGTSFHLGHSSLVFSNCLLESRYGR